jgi:DNA polymerase-3 subunit beta
MRVTVLQENLNRALEIASKAIDVRSVMLNSNNILLTADHDRLKITGTGSKLSISCWIASKTDSPGSFAVHARLLTDFVSMLPTDSVDIILPPISNTLQLKCGRQCANIMGIHAKDFPIIPRVNEGISIDVPIKEFQQAIKSVLFAVAQDESRPVLTGVNVSFSPSTMTLASADGFRLAIYKLPVKSSTTGKFIIPLMTLTMLNRVMGNDEGNIKIIYNQTKKSVLFTMENMEISSQIVDGMYPNYNQLIPKKYDTRAVVDVQSFIKLVKIIAPFSKGTNEIIRVLIKHNEYEIPNGKLIISAQSNDLGNGQGDIEVDTEGEESKIAIMSKYLLEAFSSIKDTSVNFDLLGPSDPIKITPVKGESFIHIIMPMFVQW